jgi:hypothetical protein
MTELVSIPIKNGHPYRMEVETNCRVDTVIDLVERDQCANAVRDQLLLLTRRSALCPPRRGRATRERILRRIVQSLECRHMPVKIFFTFGVNISSPVYTYSLFLGVTHRWAERL